VCAPDLRAFVFRKRFPPVSESGPISASDGGRVVVTAMSPVTEDLGRDAGLVG
jgi:hypothetical protein